MDTKILGMLVVGLIGAPVAANAQTETLDYSAGIFSGSVILSTPLPQNGTNVSVSPAEWNFSQVGYGAGYNLLPSSRYTLGGMAEEGGAAFSFTTKNGVVSAWDVDIDFTGTGGTNTETSLYATISNSGNSFVQQAFGAACIAPPGQPSPCQPITGSSSNVGGWKAVPEIAPSLAIGGVVVLLGGLCVLRGRR